MLGAPRLRQRLVRRRVACATGRLICIYLYLVFYFFYTSIYLSVSLEVTVTSLNPPRLCRIAVFSVKPTFLSESLVQTDVLSQCTNRRSFSV